ncbi:MAG: serine/threonine-protein kinase [Gemmatimonadota bacterium]
MSDPAQHALPTLLKEALGDAYTIEGEIGRGGMGVVYRARDERLQRRVAVKVLPPELAFSREIRERFTREAQTAAKLAHPHIVPIHDVGEGQGIVYFVMGLIEGESLAARIRRRGRVPADETRRIMKETADALSAAHGQGVIHRDIKPDNILLEGTRGRVMVTDFGIAKAMSGTSNATLTSAGMAIGTPSYMSPEQAAGEREIDGRSDLYSLGVVAFQMLSGELPFNAPTVAGILMKHITEPAALLHEKFADIPEDLSLAVARCLEKDPTNRWPSADGLRRSLESRNVAGYRPTGLGWKAETRPKTPGGRSTRPLRPLGDRPSPRSLDRTASERPRSTVRPTRAVGERPGARPTSRDRDAGANLPARGGARGVASARDAAREARRRAKGEAQLPQTGEPVVVREARAEFAKFVAVFGGCFMINIATGFHSPWSLFVGGAMSFGLFKRYSNLWQAGYSWRDVLNRPDAPDAIAGGGSIKKIKGVKSLAAPTRAEFGSQYDRMMQLHGDRIAILTLWGKLNETDKNLLPEMIQTVEGLHDRAVDLAQALNAMDGASIDTDEVLRIDVRLNEVRARPEGEERDRQIAMLERQRQARSDLASRRTQMADRFESCVLAMQNLRFDILRLRQSGVGAVINDLTQATQQARALSRDVDNAIEVATELREAL